MQKQNIKLAYLAHLVQLSYNIKTLQFNKNFAFPLTYNRLIENHHTSEAKYFINKVDVLTWQHDVKVTSSPSSTNVEDILFPSFRGFFPSQDSSNREPKLSGSCVIQELLSERCFTTKWNHNQALNLIQCALFWR